MQKDPYGALNERMEDWNRRTENKHGNIRADKSKDVVDDVVQEASKWKARSVAPFLIKIT